MTRPGSEEESCAGVDSVKNRSFAVLKESEAGMEGELCRRHGITRTCFYRWKSKCGGMEVSEAKRLRALEEENRQLKHIVAEPAVDIRALKAVVAKKW
jgi:putative transposase